MGKIIEMMGFPASYVWSPEGSGSLAPHNSETTKKTWGDRPYGGEFALNKNCNSIVESTLRSSNMGIAGKSIEFSSPTSIDRGFSIATFDYRGATIPKNVYSPANDLDVLSFATTGHVYPPSTTCFFCMESEMAMFRGAALGRCRSWRIVIFLPFEVMKLQRCLEQPT